MRFHLDPPPGSRTRRFPVAPPDVRGPAERTAPARDERRGRARRRRTLALAVVLLAVAATAFGVLRATRGDAPLERPVAPTGALAGVPRAGSVLGRADAPATLELYLDLRCRACIAFGASALPRLIDDEVRTGRLRILLRPVVARGLASERAARLAYAAELQDRMWPFVMALLASQHAGRDAALDDARLRGVAVSVPGLDVARAMAAARGETTSAALRQAQRRALARGVATTPGFLLGPTGRSMRPVRADTIAASSLSVAIAALRADLRRAGRTERTPSTRWDSRPRFARFAANGFRARLPTGRGWGRPETSQPAPGRLFRTIVRGPGGAFVFVDYTPRDKPVFGGRFTSRRRVRQPAFGSAVRYVFHEGPFAGCRRSRCVDHQIAVRGTPGGLAVLAGGPRFALTRRLASAVTASLRPARAR